MRAPSEEPQGLVYRPELSSADEEAGLRARLETLRFDPIVMHGRAARRTGRHFGLDYDYETRTPKPGEPVPDRIGSARERAAELSGHVPQELAEVLVQRYRVGSTIGWHRDASAFDVVVGISLGGFSRLRFQRGKREKRRVWEIGLEPRSGYVLSGEARRSFRTLRERG